MTININEFAQVPVRGQLDLQISRSGVISGEISANESGAPKAGDPVILDSAQVGSEPQFKIAGDSDLAIGYLAYDVKKSSPVSGDAVAVAYFGGPVIWQVAGGTLAPGDQLEESSGKMVVLSSGKFRGIALDPATTNQLFRMIIMTNVAPAS